MADEHPIFPKGVESICAGLSRDFPDGEFEVVAAQCLGGRVQRCSLGELQGALDSLGNKVSKVTVEYHPQNTYGFVAELRSPDIKDNEGKLKPGKPRIYIMVIQVGGAPFAVGSTPAARQVFEMDEEF